MTHHDQIAKLRREYSKQVMDESSVAKDPFTQFTSWFNEAVEVCSGEPNAMALATLTADGVPSVRMLLLKGFDKSGFSFHSNYQSRKGHELDENPRAEMLFYWNDLERQVRISGKIEKLPRAESVAYFVTRPRGALIWSDRIPKAPPWNPERPLRANSLNSKVPLKIKRYPVPIHGVDTGLFHLD